jgi:hypothetical protein
MAVYKETVFFHCHHMPLRGLPSRLWPKCNSEDGTLMRRSYVVLMRWMVIHEYQGPGGALNLNSTKLPRPWSPWGSSPSRKNPHGRAGNRTRDLMISSQKLWTPDHEAGRKRFISKLNCMLYHSNDIFMEKYVSHISTDGSSMLETVPYGE